VTFLPILGRELRLRARSRGNYWGRVMVGAAGVFVCASPLIWSMPFVTQGQMGQSALGGLVGAAFLLCCAACLVTCDTISSERREGTLGLLLLTRVRHIDVLLGKFASTGLTSFLSLLAFLPILMLPLLTGGVTGGEAARKLLALYNTLFLALSVGLWASARGVERFQSVRAALLVLAAIVLLPPLIGWILPPTHMEMGSPLTTLVQAGAGSYKTFPSRYWLSLGIVQVMSWALLAWAATCLRKNLLDDGEDAKRDSGKNEAISPTSQDAPVLPSDSAQNCARMACRYCGRVNDTDSVFCRECGIELNPRKPELLKPSAKLSSVPSALHWLLHRRRGVKALLWTATGFSFFSFTFYGIIGRFFFARGASLWMGISQTASLVLTAITGGLFAWAASRFFVEARRTGELELLLTTPVGAQEIVSTQWKVLLRLIRLPFLVMLLPLGFQALTMMANVSNFGPRWGGLYPFSLALSGVNIVVGTFAVWWVALWLGLRISGQGRVILWTVFLAKVLPYAFALGWSYLCNSWFRPMMQSGPWSVTSWLLISFAPQLANLLFFLLLIQLASSRLLHQPVRAEPLDQSGILPRVLRGIAAAFRRAREWRQV
jgi:hypothetical protein